MLDPYAVTQQWRLPGADPDWPGFLNAYMLALAQACKDAGAPVIGHIKALALFPAGGYYRVSVVDASLPPTVEGQVPARLETLTLTLNLIVYGLERSVLEGLTGETSLRLAESWRGEVINRPNDSIIPGGATHHHHG